ncbi:MAG: 1-(5-phosphoribosyl)-5-[(5-phosphoribosylamino)methylideneamino] imidazole-4-carboxamide isomerase [Spirochaetota bacterium]
MLTLYPAIDLIAGRCVRLMKGDFERQSHYESRPEEWARRYREAGSDWLHVIDLDAAKSRGAREQFALIRNIAEVSGLKIQCGGGIQSRGRLSQIFAAGIERAIMGSLCVKDPDFVRSCLEEFGPERIVLALDIHYRDAVPRVAIHGWQELSDKTLWQLLEEFPAARHLLCTDISRDGTLQGPNFALYRELVRRFPRLEVQASGGIAALSDLRRLQDEGISGAVLGKSLLEGRFTLEEALELIQE